ncbi:Stk1 family PASTA domain-containing Ser/Thr kinase [[Clostridium] innocuum]|uniref:Stk1 family PASTA domain-containing Ser/Thr kinase n=1 Tax=Clostridium innocuum TaxID=1522 RepID=UPI003A4D9849
MNNNNKMIAERYMIVSSLGEGGMADVYLAIDTILNREVAIKVLRGELSKDPVTLLRFQREANAVSKLNHPNVVDVYDVGEFEGRHYIVMEYVRGRTLKQLISQRGALHQEEAVIIMIQLTSAVQHAHENDIIHRDIKPQNVLVKDDGTVKITDFGIALAHDTVQLTQSDAVLGSAHYLAPETTRGETPSNQVDIYALGIVFYELLTGNVPFHGDNPVQIAMKHLREEIPSVRDFNPTLPQSVENIIIKATVKNRKLRYQSAKDMLYDLHRCLLPEYAHVEKLVFEEEHPQPTMVMEQRKQKQTKKTEVRKKHVEPIEEDEEDDSGNRKITTIIIAMIVGLCVIGVAAFVLMSGIFDKEKMIKVPELSTSQTQQEAIQTLTSSGFKKDNITIKQELSDDVEKGHVIRVSPDTGEEIGEKSKLTLTVSRGTWFVVKDYRHRLPEEVEKELNEQNPNIKLEISYEQRANTWPGYIAEQSGLEIGEKLDPDKEYTLKITVSQLMSWKIEGVVGKTAEEAIALIKEKTGILPVSDERSYDDLSEEEQKTIKKGVVTDVDPAEGTEYVQQMENPNVITIRFYK